MEEFKGLHDIYSHSRVEAETPVAWGHSECLGSTST